MCKTYGTKCTQKQLEYFYLRIRSTGILKYCQQIRLEEAHSYSTPLERVHVY